MTFWRSAGSIGPIAPTMGNGPRIVHARIPRVTGSWAGRSPGLVRTVAFLIRSRAESALFFHDSPFSFARLASTEHSVRAFRVCRRGRNEAVEGGRGARSEE